MRKNKIIAKIASVGLVVATLIATCDLPTLTREVFADNGMNFVGSGSVEINGSEVRFTPNSVYVDGDEVGYCNYTITENENGELYCNYMAAGATSTSNTNRKIGNAGDTLSFIVEDSATVTVGANLKLSSLDVQEGGKVDINSGSTVTVTSDNALKNGGRISNYGTINSTSSTLNLIVSANYEGTYEGIAYYNYGTIGSVPGVSICNVDVPINCTLENYGEVYGGDLTIDPGANITDGTDSIWKASGTFQKGVTNNFSGTVVAVYPETIISSPGGDFTMELEGAKKDMTGVVYTAAGDQIPQIQIVKKDGYSGPYLFGTTYDPRTKLEFTLNGSTYTPGAGDVTIKYYTTVDHPAANERSFPTAENFAYASSSESVWYPVITVKGTSTARGATLSGYDARINVNRLSWDDPSDFVIVSATEGNPGWYTSDVVYTAKEGYEIRENSEAAFSGSTIHPVSDGQHLNWDASFFVRRKSDGAETAAKAAEFLNVEYSNSVDKAKPSLSAVVDGTATEVSEDTKITARNVDLVVSDRFLSSVTLISPNGVKDYNEEDFRFSGDGISVTATIPITVVPGTTEYTIVAKDKAGNVLNRTVELTYTLGAAESAVTVGTLDEADGKYKVTAGTEWTPSVKTDSDCATKDIVFEYKKKGEADSAYSKTKPKTAGDYIVRATTPATKKYKVSVCEAGFTVVRGTASAKLDSLSVLSGTDYTPVLTTNSDAEAVFTYKPAGADDSAYTTDEPRAEGEYSVRATLGETDSFYATSCESTLTIKNLSAPNAEYSCSGKKGKKDYYTGDISISAPEGFRISETYGDGYANSILYHDGLSTIYYERVDDGAWTGAVDFHEEFKIDKDSPKVLSAVDETGASVKVGANTKVFADELSVTIADDHLDNVTVEGYDSDIEVTNGKCVVTLDPGKRKKTYTIVAEDEAGNTYTAKVTLTATWVKDRKIRLGSAMTLEMGEPYTFDPGQWKVKGDKTLYNGGHKFYVTKEGDYTFESAN